MLQQTTNDIVNKLSTKNIDMSGRRVVNASDAVNKQDYVTKNDLQTGLAPTTDAGNLTSGVLPYGRLPNPTLKDLGGVKSVNKVAHEFVEYIDGRGNPILVQPAYTDISGSIPSSALPNDPAVAHEFVTSINTSGVILRAQPSYSDISGSPAPTTQASPGRALNTIYQNTNVTPRFVTVSLNVQSPGGLVGATVFTGAGSPPGGYTAQALYGATQASLMPVSFIVLPNYYYELTSTGTVGTNVSVSLWVEWN